MALRSTVVVVLFITLLGGSLGLSAEEATLFYNDGTVGEFHGFSGFVNITDNGDTWTLLSNGIPDHVTGDFPIPGSNPNSIAEQNFNFQIPKNPTVASDPTCLAMGIIGIAKNGVAIFNPFTLEGCNAVEGSGAEEFDECSAHPAPDSTYHYHKAPNCILDGSHDQFVGVALDGFPIYGPLNSAGENITSADLDECHGETVNGNYRYRVTYDYPYYLGCYKGGYVSGMGGPAMMRKKRQSGPPGGGPPGGGPPGGGGECSFANQATLEASPCYTIDGNGNGANAGSNLHTSFMHRVGLVIFSYVVINFGIKN